MGRPGCTAFLVDGIGAVLSTVATSTILFALQPWLGMPSPALAWLAVLAATFAAYSLGCWSRRAPLVPWLPVVMVANLLYCGLVGVLLVRHAAVITPLGLAYFIGEMAVIVGVVLYERSALRSAAAPGRSP